MRYATIIIWRYLPFTGPQSRIIYYGLKGAEVLGSIKPGARPFAKPRVQHWFGECGNKHIIFNLLKALWCVFKTRSGERELDFHTRARVLLAGYVAVRQGVWLYGRPKSPPDDERKTWAGDGPTDDLTLLEVMRGSCSVSLSLAHDIFGNLYVRRRLSHFRTSACLHSHWPRKRWS